MKKLMIALYTGLFLVGMTTDLYAAQNNPVEVVADTLDYDSVKGQINAQGSVRITQESAVLTGTSVQYNTKSQEAYATGGVKVVKDDTTLTSAEVRSYNNTHYIATGDAVMVKGDNTLTGPKIEYFSDRQYAIVPESGRMTMPDGVMTADQIEAFMDENRAVGSGNVHMVSETRKMDATADHAVYYSEKEKQGKVVLTGNAKAVQEGNVLTGEVLNVYLDDKAMDAQGRPKLVIYPQ